MYTIQDPKDPADVLDYKFDFKAATNNVPGNKGDWLEASETITTIDSITATGITVNSYNITDAGTTVTIWLSGGTAGNDYTVACKITTSAGRTVEKSMVIMVRDN